MTTASKNAPILSNSVELPTEKVKSRNRNGLYPNNRYNNLVALNPAKKDKMIGFMATNGVSPSVVLTQWKYERTKISYLQNTVIDKMVKSLKLVEA